MINQFNQIKIKKANKILKVRTQNKKKVRDSTIYKMRFQAPHLKILLLIANKIKNEIN